MTNSTREFKFRIASNGFVLSFMNPDGSTSFEEVFTQVGDLFERIYQLAYPTHSFERIVIEGLEEESE